MRAVAWCWIGLVFVLAGCGAYESDAPSSAGAKSAAECKTGECCSSQSRSRIMQGNATVKADEKNQ